MQIPHGAIVAVADGEILNLFRNAGDEVAPQLAAMDDAPVSSANKGSGGRHHSSSANPSDSQTESNPPSGSASTPPACGTHGAGVSAATRPAHASAA